jgi:hypothetical protein
VEGHAAGILTKNIADSEVLNEVSQIVLKIDGGGPRGIGFSLAELAMSNRVVWQGKQGGDRGRV